MSDWLLPETVMPPRVRARLNRLVADNSSNKKLEIFARRYSRKKYFGLLVTTIHQILTLRDRC